MHTHARDPNKNLKFASVRYFCPFGFQFCVILRLFSAASSSQLPNHCNRLSLVTTTITMATQMLATCQELYYKLYVYYLELSLRVSGGWFPDPQRYQNLWMPKFLI